MSGDSVLVSADGGGLATVTLNRPERHNAFDEAMIAELTAALAGLGADDSIRMVVLRAAGRSFSAGGDLGWMQRLAGASEAENRADALRLAALMRTLDRLPKPTVAVVRGSAFGGGVGLVACCDIALAAEGALFSLSEVRLGLIPAVISPYVAAAMGERACRRYFLTAERFSAAEALRLGLLHGVYAEEGLEPAVDAVLKHLRAGAPQAQAAAKELLFAVARRPTDEAVIVNTAEAIARCRASAEGREGIAAFLEKRPPAWSR